MKTNVVECNKQQDEEGLENDSKHTVPNKKPQPTQQNRAKTTPPPLTKAQHTRAGVCVKGEMKRWVGRRGMKEAETYDRIGEEHRFETRQNGKERERKKAKRKRHGRPGYEHAHTRAKPANRTTDASRGRGTTRADARNKKNGGSHGGGVA